MKSWMKILILILCLLGLSLQVAAAAQKSFWEDEAFTASVVQSDYSVVIQRVAADRHPPLYFLAAAAWGRAFGFTELPLRSLSVLLLVPVFGLAFLLGREIYGEKAALFALGLIALSPFFVTYGQSARYYAMSAALSLAVVLAFVRYLDTNRFVYLAGYTLAGAAFLYVTYPAAAVLLACNLWWLLEWIRSRGSFRRLVAWGLAQVVIALLFLPWLPTLERVTQSNMVAPTAVPGLLMEILKRCAYLFFSFGVGEAYSPLNPLAWIGLVVILGLAVLAVMGKARRAWLPLLVFLLVAVVNILISIFSVFPVSAWQSVPNRMLYGFPFLALWLAWGLTRLKPAPMKVAAGALLVVYGFGLFNYFSGREYIKPFLEVPWRAILSNIRAQAAPDAVVICTRGDTTCPYYVKRYGFTPYYPANWDELKKASPSQVWWIQINLGTSLFDDETYAGIFSDIRSASQEMTSDRYAPQDSSIRWLKSRFLHQEDYLYRVEVYEFSGQSAP